MARYFIEPFRKLKTFCKLKTICLFNFPNIHSMISFILINAFKINQRHHFLYKCQSFCFNKSVLNWTFCQSLLCPKKNQIAQNIYSLNPFWNQSLAQINFDRFSSTFLHTSLLHNNVEQGPMQQKLFTVVIFVGYSKLECLSLLVTSDPV